MSNSSGTYTFSRGYTTNADWRDYKQNNLGKLRPDYSREEYKMPPPPPRTPQLLHKPKSLPQRNLFAEALERKERENNKARKLALSSPTGYHNAMVRNEKLLESQRRAKELLEKLKKQKLTRVTPASSYSVSNQKKRASTTTQNPNSKKQRLGGNSKIYIGPKNGKFIIKNGSKVYIDNKTLTNNVQYKKRKPKKNNTF
jgi:hypothetical protein